MTVLTSAVRTFVPLDIVSGQGFTTLAQGLINIGARYGAADDMFSRQDGPRVIGRRSKQRLKKQNLNGYPSNSVTG